MLMRKAFVVMCGIIGLSSVAFGHGMSEADQLRAVDGGILEFLRQGAVHMITGYDHLLFLFGVVFFLTQFKDIVKFVTAFTLGHSITLIGATFMGIHANYFLIDAIIALTVCYKGFDNLGGFQKYLDMKSPNLVGMVFIFGLIHGFGLSTRLQTLTIGEGMDLFGKIIAFNVGVEAGQIGALVIIIAILAGWRRTASFQRFSIAANSLLIVLGGLLFLMQLHGYSHERDPMGFFDDKAHQHQHEDMGIGGGEHSHDDVPEGMHVDEPGGVPHADHDEDEHGHSHDEADDHGHSHDENPEGMHVDEPGGTPHADHDDDDHHHDEESAHDDHAEEHSHAESGEHTHLDEFGLPTETHADHAEETHDHDEIPEGMHVDEPGGTPHADHDDDDHHHDDDHGHDH
jgi:hypothetical protein